MTKLEFAHKYVFGKHDAFTDNQEIIDMVEDLTEMIKKDRAKQLTEYVRKDRELLISFAKYIDEPNDPVFNDLEGAVDEFIDN
jgi:hypothetical protein